MENSLMMQTETTSIKNSADALRRLAQSRDPQAWAQLINSHGDDIYQITFRILRNKQLAEDGVQETFLQIRDHAGQFTGNKTDDNKAASAWISRIACSTALQLIRKRKSEKNREVQYQQSRKDQLQTSNRLFSSENIEALRKAVFELPPTEQSAVVAYYYGHLNYEQLAAQTSEPIGTIKARVHRGMEKLRRRMAVLGVFLAPFELIDLLQKQNNVVVDSWNELNHCCKDLIHSSRTPSFPFSDLHYERTWIMKLSLGSLVIALLFGSFMAISPSNGASKYPVTPKMDPAPLQASHQNSEESFPAKKNAIPGNAEDRLKAVVQGNTQFAFDLYKKLREKDEGNLFFSPYSISTALAMTYAGARGQTEKEMADTLHFTLPQNQLHPAFGQLINTLNGPGGNRDYQLSVANALWGQTGFPFKAAFIKQGNQSYGAGLKNLDFINATERSRSRVTINMWVEKKTKNKIKELLQKGILTKATRLVLTNAIYFKGDWVKAFDKKKTRNASFYLDADKKVSVPMMNRKAEFKFMQHENFKTLEMPYKGKELSMMILLPNRNYKLETLEETLSPDVLKTWSKRMGIQKVDVTIPKFKMTIPIQLGETLKDMGMKHPFTRYADFSGMYDKTKSKETLMISKVIHKAFIDVNEEGTEAAAATAVVMAAPISVMPRNPSFYADRPFVFLIRHNKTGSILFMGRVMDPRG